MPRLGFRLTAAALAAAAAVTACRARDSGADSVGAAAASKAAGAASSAGGRSSAAATPPTVSDMFVDRGACPFECCTYGAWEATGVATLRAEPDSSSPVVATVARGDRVTAVTGEVHVFPGRFVLDRAARGYRIGASAPPEPADSFARGDTLGVYTYRGEGAWKVRRAGSDAALVDLMLAYPGTGCERDGRCDGSFLRMPRSTWWIRIRASSGATGWTADAQAFKGKDACGG